MTEAVGSLSRPLLRKVRASARSLLKRYPEMGMICSSSRILGSSRSRAALIVAALAWVALALPASAQIRFDWTAEEIHCAETLGIPLGNPTNPGAEAYLRHLAWLANVVMEGEVLEVEYHEPRLGCYGTSVYVSVSETHKGSLESPTFTLRLKGNRNLLVGEEPRFHEGEKVLLFLSKGYDRPSYDPERCALSYAEYTLVDYAKLILDGDEAIQDDCASLVHPLERAHADIRVTVDAQKTNCEGDQGATGGILDN